MVSVLGLDFISGNINHLQILKGHYDPVLVISSFFVAWVGSYATLTVAGSLRTSRTRIARNVWLAAGSISMGVSIWAMHFVGMLAFKLPVITSHILSITILSMGPAILAGLIFLKTIEIATPGWTRKVAGGLALGSGIGFMHYLGMAGMEGDFGQAYYPWPFALSLIIAVALAVLAFYCQDMMVSRFGYRASIQFFLTAPTVALSISCMHYTGMQAVLFYEVPKSGVDGHILSHGVITVSVISATLLISLISVASTTVNKIFVELQQSILVAGEAVRAEGDFLARMSHEIRTPMNAIIGMARLCKRTQLSAKQTGYVDIIETAATDLLGLVNSILDYSKIDAGKMVIVSEAFTMDDIRSRVVNLLSMKAREKSLELELTVSSNTPEIMYGDSLRIVQIIVNLTANAIRFTESGSVKIAVDIKPHRSGKLTFICSVSDTGIGMTDEDASGLFEAFAQVDSSVTRKDAGTGLGLVICRQLCGLMGGAIWVDTQKGVGSTFHFTLQVDSAGETDAKIALPEALRVSRILVVGIDEDCLKLVAQALSNAGLDIIYSQSVDHAARLLRESDENNSPFQVVIANERTNGMKTTELASYFQIIPGVRTSPEIILLSFPEQNRDVNLPLLPNQLLEPSSPSFLYRSIIQLIIHSGHFNSEQYHAREELNNETTSELSINGVSILLVEDNLFNQQVAMETLENFGALVDLAEDGLECLNKLERSDYDVVLMDIQMPKMDGLTAAKEIRRRWPDRGLPIVAMTAHAMPDDEKRSLQAGMNQHITKPFDPVELRSSIHYWAGKSERVNQGHMESIQTTVDGNDLGDETLGLQTDAVFPQEKDPADRSCLDLALLLEHAGGDRSAMCSLLESFTRSFNTAEVSMRNLIESNDLERAAALAHSMKPASVYLGSTLMNSYAVLIDNALKGSDVDLAMEYSDSFDEELNRIHTDINRIVENNSVE